MTTGMLLGKFLPPHLGHVYLGEFAANHVDDLTVVVCSLAREPIPGELRYRWMRELFPFARVLHLTDELPQEPAEHPDFWALWDAALRRVLPHAVDRVFASEDYGASLAKILGATFVPVDKSRSAVPVSGTKIRTDPMTHWEHIPRCVRPYFARRVSVFGPESVGKSTLAAALARHFNTAWVPEYARTLIEANGGTVTAADMPAIIRGQLASEAALARNANRVLICDTDPAATLLWSETLFGAADPFVREAAEAAGYDLTLLLAPDVPWVADAVRYTPDTRGEFFARCRELLRSTGRNVVEVAGTWEERWATATVAVADLMSKPEARARE